MFEDDEKDLNIPDDSNKDSDAISWDDLLSEESDIDLSVASKGDAGEDSGFIDLNTDFDAIGLDGGEDDILNVEESNVQLDTQDVLDLFDDSSTEVNELTEEESKVQAQEATPEALEVQNAPLAEETALKENASEALEAEEDSKEVFAQVETEPTEVTELTETEKTDEQKDFDDLMELEAEINTQDVSPEVASLADADLSGILADEQEMDAAREELASLNEGQTEDINSLLGGEFQTDAENVNADTAPNFAKSTPVTSKKQNKNAAPIVLAVVLAFLVAGCVATGFYYYKTNGGLANTPGLSSLGVPKEDPLGEKIPEGEELPELETEQNKPLPPEGVPADASQPTPSAFGEPTKPLEPVAEKKEEKVVVKVVNTGRLNPFKPIPNFNPAGYTTPKNVEVVPPPEILGEDENVGKIVDITVAGILFDNIKPSAIINIDGVDHFVQRGDVIDQFIVAIITPTDVVIRNGKNLYKASIGQKFNIKDGIKGQTNYVYNRSTKSVTRQYFTPKEEDEVKVNVKK